MATFRPEFHPPWIGLPHVTAITLNRLGRHDGASLVERLIANAHALPIILPPLKAAGFDLVWFGVVKDTLPRGRTAAGIRESADDLRALAGLNDSR